MTTYEKNIFNDSFCYIQTIEKIQINTKLHVCFTINLLAAKQWSIVQHQINSWKKYSAENKTNTTTMNYSYKKSTN